MTSTTDTILLIIVSALLSILLLSTIFLVVMAVKLISSIKRVTAKAEELVDTVESAADVLKDTKGRLAFFKLIRNIIKLVQKRYK
jgi:biopolymer transport protein ExbB/TolQ